MPFRLSLLALSAVSLFGCASVDSMAPQGAARAGAAVKAFENSAPSRAAVREISSRPADFVATAAPRVKGDVNLRAAAAPFAPILSELGKQAGYSVAFSQVVDASRKVTVNFTDAVTEDAIRTTAFLAGYVAVIDRSQRTVMISDVATYTYRLPASLFSALQAKYNIGGNPSASSGSSAGAGSSSLKSEFTIDGVEGSNPKGLAKFLQDVAGQAAEVYVADSGHVSVRGGAQSLRRVGDFMKGFAKDAMTQVEIEASVIEVSLTRSFALGIQWGEVVKTAANGAMTGSLVGGNASSTILGALNGATTNNMLATAATNGVSGGVSTFRVSNSSASLIDALAQYTDVNIVSQPKLLSMNNVPATFFDGTQLPYMGSITQTPASVAGADPTVSGTVAFAIDGVSFSAVPSVVNGNAVQITLIPVLSSVNRFETFLGGLVTAPVQGNKQTYMRVLAESGKTLILGGIRYNKESKDTKVPNGVNNSANTKEVVILLRANVIEAPAFDPVVSESL